LVGSEVGAMVGWFEGFPCWKTYNFLSTPPIKSLPSAEIAGELTNALLEVDEDQTKVPKEDNEYNVPSLVPK